MEPGLTRLCASIDGAIKANFDDSSCLVLSPSGSNFVVVLKDGKRQRQLTEFALSRYVPTLTAVLEFRNMHMEQPYFCSKLLHASREGMKLGFRLSDIWWPGSAAEALAKGLVQAEDDGKLTVCAEDGAGRIALHQNRRRVAVCFPLLVRDAAQDGAYEYVWQTQVFSLLACPSRWEPAVDLLLDLARQSGSSQDANLEPVASVSVVEERLSIDHLLLEPAHLCIQASGTGEAARRTDIPCAQTCSRSGLQDSCPSDAWWYEQTLTLFPESTTIVLEWTPQALFQFHPDIGEAEAWLHADESCLSTTRQGRFVAHHRQQPNGPPLEQMYAAHCVPESIWGTGSRLNLASIAAHATKFRQQMAASLSSTRRQAAPPGGSCISGRSLLSLASCPPPQASTSMPGLGLRPFSAEESFAVASDVIVEEASVPGEGTFCAYADGRLRVCFLDRTILHMNAARSHCKVVLPDGQSVLVGTAQPVGVEAYVHAALAFAVWAFKPAAQRRADHNLQARAQAELNNLRRVNLMLDWPAGQLPGGRVPPGDMLGPNRQEELPPFTSGDVEAMLRKNRELVERLL